MYDYNPYSRTTVELWLYNYSTYSRTTVELWSYNYRSFSRTTKESLQKPFTNNHITSCFSMYCDFLSYFQYSQQNKSRMKIRKSQQGIYQKKLQSYSDQYFGKTENNSLSQRNKKRDVTLGDIPIWETNTYLKFNLYLLSASACLVSAALGP